MFGCVHAAAGCRRCYLGHITSASTRTQGWSAFSRPALLSLLQVAILKHSARKPCAGYARAVSCTARTVLLMELNAPATAATEPKRPLGVWIITIYLGIMAGLFPLIAGIGLFASGSGFVGPLGLAFTVLLAVGIIISAVGAWRGSARARDVLVALAVLHYLALAFNNGMLALNEAVPDDRLFLTWGRVVRSLVYAGIIVWYFRLSGRPDDFYRHQL